MRLTTVISSEVPDDCGVDTKCGGGGASSENGLSLRLVLAVPEGEAAEPSNCTNDLNKKSLFCSLAFATGAFDICMYEMFITRLFMAAT